MTTTNRTQTHSIGTASIWMVGLSILLGWIPVVGPAVAGFVGGRKAGSPGGALAAGAIPALVLAVLVGLVLALFDLPVLGTLTGVAVFVWALVQAMPLLLAAGVGGWVEQEATGPADRATRS